GLFNMVEDPGAAGVFYGTVAPEFHTHASGTLLRITDREADLGMHENGRALHFDRLTDTAAGILYRNPVMLSDGTLIASVDEIATGDKTGERDFYQFRFRLYTLRRDPATGYYVPDRPILDEPMRRSVEYWSGPGIA